MKGNKKSTLENQITSMLNQMLDEEKSGEDKLFFSDDEEEENEKDKNCVDNKNLLNFDNQKIKRVCFNEDNNYLLNNYNNEFIRQNKRKEKKFQTVNENDHNNNFFQLNPLLNHQRNYFQTQIIHNPFNFNNNIINSIPNNNYLLHNYIMNNINNQNNNYNNQSGKFSNIFFQRNEKRKTTYDGKNIDMNLDNTKIDYDNKKFGSVVFPKETNLKVELILYELKNSLFKTDKIDHFIYSKVQGNFVNIIKTHRGSRIFQNYLKNTHSDIIHQIFQEINPSLIELIIDPYANYFCKRFFNFLNQKDKIDFLLSISNSLTKLSINNIGTYPIQGIIEQIGSKNEKKIIIDGIKDSINELCYDTYGTHVLEKIISCFEEEFTGFIFDFVEKNFLNLSNHINGICIVKKILSLTHKKDIHDKLKKIIKENAFNLIQHAYGNYVIQVIVENWDLNEILEILSNFHNKFTILSMSKYSSNVVERCIEKSPIILREYINEICENGRIAEIMKNNFGNYVIQKALKISLKNDKKLILKWKSIVSPHLDSKNNQDKNSII